MQSGKGLGQPLGSGEIHQGRGFQTLDSQQQNPFLAHKGLRALKFKPEGSGVGLEPWKPGPPPKDTLDPGWRTHTPRGALL